jgi:SAM-dependent methyltransferase
VSAPAGGARRIFLYNWPVFVSTWTVAIVAVGGLVAVGADRMGLAWRLVAIAAIGGGAWSVVALVVSHVVYDRSVLASGSWVPPLLPAVSPLRWVAIDAGLDAEVALDRAMPTPCLARLDIYAGENRSPGSVFAQVSSPSVARARAMTPRRHRAIRASAVSLPLADGSCDLVAMIFTAHEIQARDARQACFREVARALAPRGRLLLVEHLRDLPNVLAYGPGAWHFLPRREWLSLGDVAGLRVVAERRITPWVTALAFERIA